SPADGDSMRQTSVVVRAVATAQRSPAGTPANFASSIGRQSVRTAALSQAGGFAVAAITVAVTPLRAIMDSIVRGRLQILSWLRSRFVSGNYPSSRNCHRDASVRAR